MGPDERPSPARARQAVDDAHLRGSFDRAGLQRAVPQEPRQGPDGPEHRLRPTDADRLRRRSRARARRGGQGRRPRRPQGRHAHAARRHPARRDEHVDDDQRDGRLAAGALHRHRRGPRRREERPPGHDAERHHQGVPRARDLRLPAGAEHAADRRHDRLHGHRGPEVEPHQHLQLPPAGGRRDAGPGDRLRALQRDRRARRGAGARPAGADGQGLQPPVVLRQRRRALRRGAREAARDGRAVGADRPRALRRRGSQAPALPLRRAGQLARAHRVPAREQRPAHRARGARRDDGAKRRARAIQLPAWNEALGLPRPWDQQWSLRIQQVLAFETDLLEYPDIFEGSKVMEGLVAELVEGARAEMAVVAEHGGAVEAVPYMKAALVDSHRERIRRIEAGELIVVGHNKFRETAPSPLAEGEDGGIMTVDPGVEAEAIAALQEWRAARDGDAVAAALDELRAAAADDAVNIMPATIAAARAGATTGEWAQALRDSFGSYRAPTGVGEAASGPPTEETEELVEEVERVSEGLGRRLKILVGKPGLDGHSNGAEQIAVRAKDIGMDVVYEGIRLTPSQIAKSALDEGVHVVGLSILSGSHRELIPSVMEALRDA